MTPPVAPDWFVLEPLDHDITLIREHHVDPYLTGNIWWVRGRERDLLVDTGTGICSVREVLDPLLERPILALALNPFYDHAGSLHEFEDRGAHRLDAPDLARPTPESSAASTYVNDAMLRALPRAGYTTAEYALRPAPPTRRFDEGDAIELGERRFEVLAAPGISPGGMAIWEPATGILFTSDLLYDTPRLYDIEPHDRRAYAASLRRLRELPVTIVHAGHFPSFGPARMIELIDACPGLGGDGVVG